MAEHEWHCDVETLERYAAGGSDLALSASIETHLITCARCRGAVARLVGADDLDPVWTAVREAIQPVPLRSRVLRFVGVKPEDAVLLHASQTLGVPWALATAAVAIFTVAASYPGAEFGKALYLLVAPLVPVLGVVAAFQATDPMTELTNTTAYSKMRLALLRTLAVVVTTAPLVLVMGTLTAGIGWLSVAWLGPALGLTLSALVGLTWLRSNVVGGGLTLAWTTVVTITYQHHDLTAAIRLDAQAWYLAIAAVTGIALAIRIRSAHAPGGYA